LPVCKEFLEPRRGVEDVVPESERRGSGQRDYEEDEGVRMDRVVEDGTVMWFVARG